MTLLTKANPETGGFLETLTAQVADGQSIHATIERETANTPIAVILSQDESLDEIRFGLYPIVRLDRESQNPPTTFLWCDYKKWDSSKGRFHWESRGDEIPNRIAQKIWAALEFGW